MLKLNGIPVELNRFPDGSMLLKPHVNNVEGENDVVQLSWHFENDREFVALIYLVKHLRSHGVQKITLHMPYIPNARQDRVKTPEDVFTLKYFAEILNSLNLTSITVLDPHSSVSEALIDRLIIQKPDAYISRALTAINGGKPFTYEELSSKVTMFYPDEGAMKRYSGMVPMPYAFGIKRRDWSTGKIKGLDASGTVDAIAGKDILIVDDICSYGGTFYHSAMKLKELGANRIYLFISHCENSILKGDLIQSGLVDRIFTTDSIYTGTHERIEVLK